MLYQFIFLNKKLHQQTLNVFLFWLIFILPDVFKIINKVFGEFMLLQLQVLKTFQISVVQIFFENSELRHQLV